MTVEQKNRDGIVETLTNYATLVEWDGEYSIRFEDPFESLSVRGKILVGLSLKKITAELGSATPAVSPGEICTLTGESMNEVYPALRRLEQDRTVVNSGGLYQIPAANLTRLLDVAAE